MLFGQLLVPCWECVSQWGRWTGLAQCLWGEEAADTNLRGGREYRVIDCQGKRPRSTLREVGENWSQTDWAKGLKGPGNEELNTQRSLLVVSLNLQIMLFTHAYLTDFTEGFICYQRMQSKIYIYFIHYQCFLYSDIADYMGVSSYCHRKGETRFFFLALSSKFPGEHTHQPEVMTFPRSVKFLCFTV